MPWEVCRISYSNGQVSGVEVEGDSSKSMVVGVAAATHQPFLALAGQLQNPILGACLLEESLLTVHCSVFLYGFCAITSRSKARSMSGWR